MLGSKHVITCTKQLHLLFCPKLIDLSWSIYRLGVSTSSVARTIPRSDGSFFKLHISAKLRPPHMKQMKRFSSNCSASASPITETLMCPIAVSYFTFLSLSLCSLDFTNEINRGSTISDYHFVYRLHWCIDQQPSL